jgi:hypothetical protein
VKVEVRATGLKALREKKVLTQRKLAAAFAEVPLLEDSMGFERPPACSASAGRWSTAMAASSSPMMTAARPRDAGRQSLLS